jgi:hypothetical protein
MLHSFVGAAQGFRSRNGSRGEIDVLRIILAVSGEIASPFKPL